MVLLYPDIEFQKGSKVDVGESAGEGNLKSLRVDNTVDICLSVTNLGLQGLKEVVGSLYYFKLLFTLSKHAKTNLSK